jgi:energy-coupling factor transporter ATP-binding protein EcfA2
LRLALVGALIAGPKVLLLDEPTAALDLASVEAVESLLADRIRAGFAVAWVTHDAGQARRIARGQLVVEGRKRPGGDRPMASYITLSYLDLALASVLVLIDAGLFLMIGLKIHRNLRIAAIRRSVQLTLIGLVLTALFSLVSPLWTGLPLLAMILFAGQEVMQRQDRRLSGWWSFGLGTG